PKLVKGRTGVVSVAAGYFHACALLSTGRVWCWGDNGNGELGNGTTTASDVPVPTPLEGATAVAAGAADSCAITSGGDLKCWGNNFVGQLGIGTFTDAHSPTQVASLNSGVLQVGLGEDYGCALADIPSPACWGQMTGSGGALHTTHSSAVPVTKVPPGEVSQVTAAYGGCALIRNGGLATALRCWGDNTWGELGDGTTTDRTTSVKVQGL